MEPDYLNGVRDVFTKQIPFNQVIGMELEYLAGDEARVRIDMREELIGNFMQATLHGGVISTVLDACGGLIAFANELLKLEQISDEEKISRLANFGTIDLRVDYLRPGRGTFFIATAKVLRAGNKVIVTRMELHNDRNILIAVGTGTYVTV